MVVEFDPTVEADASVQPAAAAPSLSADLARQLLQAYVKENGKRAVPEAASGQKRTQMDGRLQKFQKHVVALVKPSKDILLVALTCVGATKAVQCLSNVWIPLCINPRLSYCPCSGLVGSRRWRHRMRIH